MRKDVPLKELHFGHEADPPINMRKAHREADVESMAASLDAHGQGYPLLVREMDGKHGKGLYVEDGNRRLAAMRLLIQRGNLTDDALVEITTSKKDGLVSGELGLALNFETVPPHEADQYEKFFELHDKHGLTAGQIAIRFGIEEKGVGRMLALGRLSPLILDAWRKGELGQDEEDAGDVVKAFTLAPNTKEQEAVYKRLKKTGRLFPHLVRDAFGANSRQAIALVSFIGIDAYKAAGGKVIEGLFEEQHAISDPALAAKLAREKLIEERDRIRGEGWAWAELSEDVKDPNWRYYWQRAASKPSAAEKANAGCVVEIDGEGKLKVTAVIKPGKAKTAKTPAAKGDVEKGLPVLSQALLQSLREMASIATLDALKNDTPANDLGRVLAGIVASQIRVPQTWHTPNAVSEKLKAIRDAITPAVMDAALQKAFDRERYFKGAPKDFVIRAIKEAVSPEQAKKLQAGTKVAAWKFALENVAKTGWLPPELRTAHYAGPGAKAEKKPAAKKAPAKKAAKTPARKAA